MDQVNPLKSKNRSLQRKRQCPYCRADFSYNYLYRHIKNCTSNKDTDSESISLSFLDESGSVPVTDHTSLLHELDDQTESDNNNENVEEIISDNELDELSRTFYYEKDDINVQVYKTNRWLILVQWFCLFLALWQYTFSIPDSALEHLLKFIKTFFKVVFKDNATEMSSIGALFPPTLYLFSKFNKTDEIYYKRFVVCTKCFSLYDIKDCVQSIAGIIESKRCKTLIFPNHRQEHRRNKKCGQILMMKYKTASGKTQLFPMKCYYYLPVVESLKRLVKRKGFIENCKLWRNRSTDENILADIYDGKIWKEFNDIDSYNFFTEDNNYGLMLNLDWFCPYKHVKTYSVGAIYAVIANLPRTERFKRENLLLIGVIPNMEKEPATNTFLKPFVDEMKTAWEPGFFIDVPAATNNPTRFKLALLLVGCDIPACRKLCGFLGHSAKMGCSKCKKEFPGPFGQRDYSGFNRSSWIKRNNETHRQEIQTILESTSQGDRSSLESQFGTRYSILTELQYYDAIRMAIIDPMHNLFSGTAKKLLKIWKEKEYLRSETLQKVKEVLDNAEVPAFIGKVPGNIDNFTFDEFTADELKNFYLLFAVFALHDILPKRDLECLRNFVIACTYLCNCALTLDDVQVADVYLIRFCKSFEELYGKNRVTPNMHLHCHLADCIREYGPIYSFWLFPFERYNGMIGKTPTNKRLIEEQFVKRFCRDTMVMTTEMPNEESESFLGIIKNLKSANVDRGTLSETASVNYVPYLQLSSRKTDYTEIMWTALPTMDVVSKEQMSLNDTEYRCLVNCYKAIYEIGDATKVPRSAWRSKQVRVDGNVFGSKFSRGERSSYITAFWYGENGEIQPYAEMYLNPRPGRIQYFVTHVIFHNGQPYEHIFARVEWFAEVNQELKHKYGKPVEIWSADFFKVCGAASFIPIQRIKSKFVLIKACIQSQNVIAVIPRNRYMNI